MSTETDRQKAMKLENRFVKEVAEDDNKMGVF